MSEHSAEQVQRLTFDERESVCIGGECDYHSLGKHSGQCKEVLAAIERVVTSRLAPFEALAAEFAGNAKAAQEYGNVAAKTHAMHVARCIRRALSLPPAMRSGEGT